jgi:hypothetical protein
MSRSPSAFTETDIRRAIAGARKGGCRDVRVLVTDKHGRKIEVFATLGDANPQRGNEWDEV